MSVRRYHNGQRNNKFDIAVTLRSLFLAIVILVMNCAAADVAIAASIIHFDCAKACANRADPVILSLVAESQIRGYDPCPCFRPPKGKSIPKCFMCVPQNCVNVTDGDEGDACRNNLLSASLYQTGSEDTDYAPPTSGTLPISGIPIGEGIIPDPIDWGPGSGGLPEPPILPPGGGGGPPPPPPPPEVCAQYAPLIGKVCSPHCKYVPNGSGTPFVQGPCCIKVFTNLNDSKYGVFSGDATSCMCNQNFATTPPGPQSLFSNSRSLCVSGVGIISLMPGSIAEGSIIAQACDPSLSSSARSCVIIDTKVGLSNITATTPSGSSVVIIPPTATTLPTLPETLPTGNLTVGGRSGWQLINFIASMKRGGLTGQDSVLPSTDRYYNWTDMTKSPSDFPNPFYPIPKTLPFSIDTTNYYENASWQLFPGQPPSCPAQLNQCYDATSCFWNPAAVCKLQSTFNPGSGGQGGGRYIPCSSGNPIMATDPSQARDSGYSQDFVIDLLYYYTDAFQTGNAYHGALSTSPFISAMSSNPPIAWLFDSQLNFKPLASGTRVMYAWTKYNSGAELTWRKLGGQVAPIIPTGSNNRRVFTLRDVEQVEACSPANTDYPSTTTSNEDYPVPTIAITVSDTYFRGHASIVYDYDYAGQTVDLLSTNWFYNPLCSVRGLNGLQFDYHNCYQINGSFGKAMYIKGATLSNGGDSRVGFLIDLNDKVGFTSPGSIPEVIPPPASR